MRRPYPLLVALALLGTAAAARPDLDAPEKRWREGPVRYLLSKDEDDAFRALETTVERADFIRAFWARRDPDPSTPENEYRILFSRRVAEADRLFTESTKPGWKTDRGKIYILLGPPDDLDLDRSKGAIDPEVILWVYRDPPMGVGPGANSTIRFVRDESGEYRLSDQVLLSGFETPLGVRFQIQAMQMKSMPALASLLESLVASPSFLDPEPFHAHGDFLRAAAGQTYAVLTFGVRKDVLGRAASDASRIEAVARLVSMLPGGPAYDLAGAGALRPWSEAPGSRGRADHVFFQGGLPVLPGEYTLFFGALDRDTGTLYPFKQSLTVPALPAGRLSLGPVNLVAGIERLPGPVRSAYPEPFVLGNLRVIPRGDLPFRDREELSFYYQVHGSESDPIDARPDFDVEYRLSAVDGEDATGAPVLRPLGSPIRLARQRDPVQGYSLLLRDWRSGTYHLRVLVTDNLSGRQASAETIFRVE
jgi:GWxTD domain-containing protein